jgi:hypothetical protein
VLVRARGRHQRAVVADRQRQHGGGAAARRRAGALRSAGAKEAA